MKNTSITTLYRWNLLCVERLNLISLRRCSTGAEQSAYRMMLQNCTDEMEALTPQIAEILKRVRRYSVMKDIIAIYFGDTSYQEWADVRGISVDVLFSSINDALDQIDREIEMENEAKDIAS